MVFIIAIDTRGIGERKKLRKAHQNLQMSNQDIEAIQGLSKEGKYDQSS